MKSRALDVSYSRKMDLTTQFGFILAVNYVRHLIRGGVAWFAMPCNSWVFMSRGSTKRCLLRVKGATHLKSTALGNRLARRLCYLLELCHKLGIFWVIEQPTTSLLFFYRPLRRLMKRHGAKRVGCSLGALNANTTKPVFLWGTVPFLGAFNIRPTALRRHQLQKIRNFLKLNTTHIYQDKRGRTRCAGGTDLKATQSYPGLMGLKVAEEVKRHVEQLPAQRRPTNVQGISFEDYGDDSSDSGLESIL
ncbi:unnamed protein product [Cladocopium goreaui]|uniref:Uncharacterized protein n=1 Tax=Cladocopium goreaui TaxID=2562237 RepID=A0A9P1GG41_9DINO|nr:unnamed protein product [Cladocopium goreaui]